MIASKLANLIFFAKQGSDASSTHPPVMVRLYSKKRPLLVARGYTGYLSGGCTCRFFFVFVS